MIKELCVVHNACAVRQRSLRDLQAGDQLPAKQHTESQVPLSMQNLCDSLLAPPLAALVDNRPSLPGCSCAQLAFLPHTCRRARDTAPIGRACWRITCGCTWRVLGRGNHAHAHGGRGEEAHANAIRRVGITCASPATLCVVCCVWYMIRYMIYPT
jgi:hypothetical protein